MTQASTATIDGNEAAASVAYRLNDVAAIYPITPSSAMGEFADEWAARGKPNIWGDVPTITEMQSEAGAAGAVHGALQAGALATTFTASQGLLLMIPNLYKIAGELTPFCMHVAARTVATHALSIFGDHSDVMACRQTGFAMLASNSVQEAHDMALVAQAASLESRVPFLHFFDGFRTSHEVAKIELLSDDDLRAVINQASVDAHRERGLSPDHPVVRGTAQNPDAFFQAREACNSFYDECPQIIERVLERFAARTGRRYGLYEYAGAPDAERVVVLMGSAVDTVRETLDWLIARGEKVGVVSVRLFRPFVVERFIEALPATVRSIAVLDRTKEPGAIGEPLYLDVLAALCEAESAGRIARSAERRVVGGRYGLSGKEFTPAMVKSVFDGLSTPNPKNHFTVGIIDDVTGTSLPIEEELDIEPNDTFRALFYGLGSDGTVGANKNSIKIIGEETKNYVQGYFVYDSKKSGAMTVSHLRFGPRPIRSTYLIENAAFVACHHFPFLDRVDVLERAAPGATFLLNAPCAPEEVWDRLPREVEEVIISKRLRLFAIDAGSVARDCGLGGRINTIMQTCFFALSEILPHDRAIECIKKTIAKTWGRKGEEVVRRNHAAVEGALEHLREVKVPETASAERHRPPLVSEKAPDFVRRVTALLMAGLGDRLPVSAFPVDGTWPLSTSRWEKRDIATEIPVWDPEICIQCDKCVLVCPHAVIRAKVWEPALAAEAPASFRSAEYKAQDFAGLNYTIQISPDDCTGCRLCSVICPAKDRKNPRHKALDMEPKEAHVEDERIGWDHFLELPEIEPERIGRLDVKGSQLLEPLFEFSGACAGCGETPYIKLLTQLFGDRLLIANATGCSSIYGGNLPTTPYRTNRDGRGPAWSNSLFEDNAEFGLGFRLAVDGKTERARKLLVSLAPRLDSELVAPLLASGPRDPASIRTRRERVKELAAELEKIDSAEARELLGSLDWLVPKSIWLVGGDGWAFDIGYGGLDHVLSLEHDVNILVLDTEVYSNTGGQASKATPLGAAAKFASRGKGSDKKDLGLMAMHYGHVYVASIAFGAKDNHTVQTLLEADGWEGPSLVIAYSHCIAHGYDMAFGCDQQKRAVSSGIWPLYRWDPRRIEQGEPPLVLDAPGGKTPVSEYMRNETRFRMVETLDPERFRIYARQAQEAAERRVAIYGHLAELRLPAAARARAEAPSAEAPSAENKK